MKIPENYLPVMPYVMVKGAYQFMEFGKNILGATQQYLIERSPGVVMHAEMRIEQAVIMFADVTDEYPAFPGGMFLYISDADAIHHRVQTAGLKLLMPLEDRDYGRGFGFADDFGNQWWINTPAA